MEAINLHKIARVVRISDRVYKHFVNRELVPNISFCFSI